MKSAWDTLAGLVLIVLGVVLAYTLTAHRPHVPPVNPAKPAPSPRHKLQLVYVRSSRCVWCDRMERATFTDERVKDRIANGFTFAKVSGKDADARYRPTGYPTYILFAPDGRELRRGTGYRTPEEFLAWLDGSPVEASTPKTEPDE